MKDRRSFVSFPALMNIEMHNNQLDDFFKKNCHSRWKLLGAFFVYLPTPLHSLLRPTSDALLLIHTNKLWSTSQMTRDTWLSFNGQRIECHWRLSLNIPMPSSHTLASSVPCRPSKLNGLGKQSEIIFWYVTIFTVLFVNFFLMWTKKYCSKS